MIYCNILILCILIVIFFKFNRPTKQLIKQYSLVRFTGKYICEQIVYNKDFDVHKDDVNMIFLGEIPNMPGHCALVNKGIITYAYHMENIRLATDDEI